MGLSLMTSRVHPHFNNNEHFAALTSQAGRRESTEASATRTFRTAFTISGLSYKVRTNTKNGDIIDTVRKNGADTALSVTIPAATTGEFEDTGSVSFAAGDTGSLALDASAVSSGTTLEGSMSAILDYGGETVIIPMATGGFNNTASSTEYSPMLHLVDFGQKSLTDSRTKVNYAAAARFAQCHKFQNSRTTDSVITAVVNGTPDTTFEMTIPGGTTGQFEDLTGSIALASGDDYCWQEVTGTGTQNMEGGQVSFELVSDVAGEFGIFAGSQATGQGYEPGPGVTEFWHLGGSWRKAVVPANEAAARHNLTLALQLDRASLYLESNGISAASTVSLRKNGVSDGPVITIPASTAGLHEDLVSAPATFAATDEASVEWATGGTGTTMVVLRYSVVARLVSAGVDNDRLARMGFAASGGGLLPWMW